MNVIKEKFWSNLIIYLDNSKIEDITWLSDELPNLRYKCGIIARKTVKTYYKSLSHTFENFLKTCEKYFQRHGTKQFSSFTARAAQWETFSTLEVRQNCEVSSRWRYSDLFHTTRRSFFIARMNPAIEPKWLCLANVFGKEVSSAIG